MRTRNWSGRLWRRSLSKVCIGIIHYPVYDKRGDIVATSVTNLEIHDIARTCMTFGIDLCYIVTPLEKQRKIAEKLIHHWIHGYGATYNPERGEALKKVRIMSSLQETIDHASQQGVPLVVGTSSRERPRKAMTYKELNEFITTESRPALVLFGTGWGLADEMVDLCDKMLVPIKGKGEYNHLSLRVALGIILDRFFSQ
jgi:tRNA (guanine37-N1)-methyltransferase